MFFIYKATMSWNDYYIATDVMYIMESNAKELLFHFFQTTLNSPSFEHKICFYLAVHID